MFLTKIMWFCLAKINQDHIKSIAKHLQPFHICKLVVDCTILHIQPLFINYIPTKVHTLQFYIILGCSKLIKICLHRTIEILYFLLAGDRKNV